MTMKLVIYEKKIYDKKNRFHAVCKNYEDGQKWKLIDWALHTSCPVVLLDWKKEVVFLRPVPKPCTDRPPRGRGVKASFAGGVL